VHLPVPSHPAEDLLLHRFRVTVRWLRLGLAQPAHRHPWWGLIPGWVMVLLVQLLPLLEWPAPLHLQARTGAGLKV
jgi:hypothetical protein